MAQLQPDQERLELRITGGEIDVCTADAGRLGSRPGRALWTATMGLRTIQEPRAV